MRKLYEINEDILTAIEAARTEAEENDGVVSDNLVNCLESLQIERDDKIEAVALYVKDLDVYSKALDDEAKRIREEKAKTAREIEGLKFYLSNALDGEKFKTAKTSISFRRSEKVVGDDVESLGSDYIRTKIEADKTAIKKALKEGVELAGWSLEENRSITVK